MEYLSFDAFQLMILGFEVPVLFELGIPGMSQEITSTSQMENLGYQRKIYKFYMIEIGKLKTQKTLKHARCC